MFFFCFDAKTSVIVSVNHGTLLLILHRLMLYYTYQVQTHYSFSQAETLYITPWLSNPILLINCSDITLGLFFWDKTSSFFFFLLFVMLSPLHAWSSFRTVSYKIWILQCKLRLKNTSPNWLDYIWENAFQQNINGCYSLQVSTNE